jgi:cysteine desulfurase / selenocysteine lyase
MDISKLRQDFPILKQKINGQDLIYFDNAATTQKPAQVIDSIVDFYSKYNSNIHRGIYQFGEYATVLFENVRNKVAALINAKPNEIVFTTGTTGAINFVALAWARKNIKKDDEIIISAMEHHSNLIPWQQLALENQAILKIIPVKADYTLDVEAYENMLSKKTKLVSIVHVSNVLGTCNDIEYISSLAHKVGARVLIDAAQSIAYQKIDVQKINCDFLAFSGHKMLGPTGIGVLYIKQAMHTEIDPYQFGGGMVFEVDFENSKWAKTPYKFEAGTPPIAQAIGLGAAIDYINKNIDFDSFKKYLASLCKRFIDELEKFEQIKIIGPKQQLKEEGHLVSFTIEGMHPHDIAAYLDKFGICIRAGHHCAQPLHKALGIESTVRVSFYAYNTMQEVDYFLIDLIKQLVK